MVSVTAVPRLIPVIEIVIIQGLSAVQKHKTCQGGNADSVVSGCHNHWSRFPLGRRFAAGRIHRFFITLTNCYCESVNGSVISSAANGAKSVAWQVENTGSPNKQLQHGRSLGDEGDNATAGGVAGTNYTDVWSETFPGCYSIGTVAGEDGADLAHLPTAGSNDTGNGAISNSYYLSDSETKRP